jgi:ribosomal protein S11
MGESDLTLAHASWVPDTSLQIGVMYINITTSPHVVLNLSMQAGIVSIMSSNNNTILTLSDMDGRVQSCISAGTLGFTNSRKATSQAAEAVGEAMAEKVCAESFSSA